MGPAATSELPLLLGMDARRGGTALQVADHVRAHPIWRYVCYKDGRVPSDAPLDATQLVDRDVTWSADT